MHKLGSFLYRKQTTRNPIELVSHQMLRKHPTQTKRGFCAKGRSYESDALLFITYAPSIWDNCLERWRTFFCFCFQRRGVVGVLQSSCKEARKTLGAFSTAICASKILVCARVCARVRACAAYVACLWKLWDGRAADY